MPDPEPTSNDQLLPIAPDGVVRLAIAGRITGAAIADFGAELERALAGPTRFAVVFDRRRMTAPTADGREALSRMAEDLMPRLAQRCLAWGDVYDERRAESLRRAADRDAGDSQPAGEEAAPTSALPYPYAVFDDHADAIRWAAGWATGRASAVPSSS